MKILLKVKILSLTILAALAAFSFPEQSKAALPVVTAANVSISGATGNGGVFITDNAQNYIEDRMTLMWNNSASGDNNSGITNVTFDVSGFGGSSTLQAYDNGGSATYSNCDAFANDNAWTACFYIRHGTLDGVANKASISVSNSNGTTTIQDDVDITVDNVSPADDSTLDIYNSDATNFFFSGTTSPNRKIYYEIWSGGSISFSDYVGQAADGSGHFSINSLDVSSMPDGDIDIYVWVQDSAGNYSPSFDSSLSFVKSGDIMSLDKTFLTYEIDDQYSDGNTRTSLYLISNNYTSESWNNYIGAINAAIAVEANVSASPSEVLSAIENIQIAEDNLVEVVLPEKVSVPSVSPVSGTYSAAQMVTLSSITSGSQIFYTTNGDTPSASSTLYTSPINVAASQIIKAIATKGGMADSDVLVAPYTINIVQQDNKKEEEKVSPRTITNSKKTLKYGSTLTQRGKKFSRNSIVKLYFSKPGGGYYAPMEVKTSKSGSFMVRYKVNKPKGTYKWYAVDTKTNRKSKVIKYRVK